MFLRQFKYLLAVVDEGHFGRAADRCFVTQPSLSSGIKQLEIELGVPIFLRGRGRRFHGLTPEGKRIADWARQILAQCGAMKEEVSRMQGNLKGRLRLGAMPSMSPVLPHILKLLRQKYPSVVVDLQFIGNESVKVGLAQFSLDAAFIYVDSAELDDEECLPLYSERLSLLVPDSDQFRNLTEITWEEVAELPLALLRTSLHERTFIDQTFEGVDCRPYPKVESESILHLMFQVQFGELSTIIPSHFRHMPGLSAGTKALDLVQPEVKRQVALVWQGGDIDLPMANAIVSIVRELDKSGELRHMIGE